MSTFELPTGKNQQLKSQNQKPQSLETPPKYEAVKRRLHDYLGIKDGDVEKIVLLETRNLPPNYQAQFKAVEDERLADVTIAVVPDDLWVKGSQPSESDAENKLILIKQSYFEAQENPDEIAWLCHELAHCQSFLDCESPEEYQAKMQKFAFPDLQTEYSYPNNPIEQVAFTKQMHYLKILGKSREDIITMLGKYYDESDFPFFNRLLDDVYKE